MRGSRFTFCPTRQQSTLQSGFEDLRRLGLSHAPAEHPNPHLIAHSDLAPCPRLQQSTPGSQPHASWILCALHDA